MQQTAYLGITTLSEALPYLGGCCNWYFIPKEDIDVFPAVNPLTQELLAEPTLKTGKNWYGPMLVLNDDIGFEEQQEVTQAGLYYKQKFSGMYAGEGRASRINLENLAYHEMVIVAKLRAGGFFIILGNTETGLDFEHTFNTGGGPLETPGSKIMFTTESLHKALILPNFLGINSVPPPDGGGSGGGGGSSDTTANETEVIAFTNESLININWTGSRAARFGSFPLIEVWLEETGYHYLAPNLDIRVDAPAPTQSLFTINIGGPATGFIVLK